MMSGSSLRVYNTLSMFSRALINLLLDSRRALFHIGNNFYSAKLVDLPCIIESQKTLDGKQMFKVADICQVLAISLHQITNF